MGQRDRQLDRHKTRAGVGLASALRNALETGVAGVSQGKVGGVDSLFAHEETCVVMAVWVVPLNPQTFAFGNIDGAFHSVPGSGVCESRICEDEILQCNLPGRWQERFRQ